MIIIQLIGTSYMQRLSMVCAVHAILRVDRISDSIIHVHVPAPHYHELIAWADEQGLQRSFV